MKARNILQLLFACSLVFPVGCDVKDPIYNTPHPEHGTVALSTDWSGRGEGIAVPTSYTVAADGYTATLSGSSHRLDHLFEPGKHSIYVYNMPEHISVSGTTASVAAAILPAGQTGTFVHNAPEWLFASVTDAVIEKDTEHTLTAVMRQQVRELTLIVEPKGEAAERIASITGTLSGIAGTLDISDGTHGMPAKVALIFSKITEGADAGRWSATVRLLGMAGGQQRLSATILYEDDNPKATLLESDLSVALATFNADKRTPCVLGGSVAETPTGAGFTATITDWTPVDGGPVTAE